MTAINMTINPADVLAWESAKSDRVYLPYRVNDDLLSEAYNAIADSIHAEANMSDFDNAVSRALDSATVTACIVPHVSRSFPSIGFVISVILADGKRLERRVPVKSTDESYTDIVNQFFQSGANGLDKSYKDYYSKIVNA